MNKLKPSGRLNECLARLSGKMMPPDNRIEPSRHNNVDFSPDTAAAAAAGIQHSAAPQALVAGSTVHSTGSTAPNTLPAAQQTLPDTDPGSSPPAAAPAKPAISCKALYWSFATVSHSSVFGQSESCSNWPILYYSAMSVRKLGACTPLKAFMQVSCRPGGLVSPADQAEARQAEARGCDSQHEGHSRTDGQAVAVQVGEEEEGRQPAT